MVSTELELMFNLQTQALKQGEGTYHLLTMEAGWAKEWASNGYTVPLLELAKLYDPDGEKAMEWYLEPYYPPCSIFYLIQAKSMPFPIITM